MAKFVKEYGSNCWLYILTFRDVEFLFDDDGNYTDFDYQLWNRFKNTIDKTLLDNSGVDELTFADDDEIVDIIKQLEAIE